MRKHIYTSISVLIVLFCYFNVSAQTTPISGSIKNRQGEPIANATVQQKGTENITMADEQGRFVMTVNGPSPALVITAIGYKNTEVEVK